MSAFGDASARVVPVDAAAAGEARARQDRLTKPPGSLGRLEAAGIQLSAIARRCPPPVPEPAVVAVFAADHGVLAEGISPWPQEVTAQMVANFGAGGAAVNVLARHVGAEVVVIDVGVAGDLPEVPGLRRSKVRAGTDNLAKGPAMSVAEAAAALDVGADLATELVSGGARCLLTGDMGIGNTTPSAALIATLCGRSPAEVTGRGTGIDDERMARKVEIVAAAVARESGEHVPLSLLASIGGLEIAALAGYIVGGAAAGVPVLLDGVIAAAAAVVAAAMVPDSTGYLFAGHLSTEPGASAALEHLGLIPLLDLDLRLGEGTGACLALPVLQAAALVLAEMATFDSAGISEGPA
jgi:nicotinate-nucleotide--dimethylbenzimidazole phosphoribosyltransferase